MSGRKNSDIEKFKPVAVEQGTVQTEAQSQAQSQLHPFSPVFDKNSQILILGSFPSVKSRENGFFYGHPQNRFWRVLAYVFGFDGELKTIGQKREFLLANGVALWDVIAFCNIEGSSDASIKNAVPTDLSDIFSTADIKKIFVNGKTAEKYYNKYQKDLVGRSAVCLPSTSPANAAWSFDALAKDWRQEIL